ncbi:GIY-YIG nuclease family protein [Candidatus Woesebacteria bacterium]|nr:GIY-YIG nuclease family protein [Candidatus Woesebacteria bacterium]
MFFVYILHGLKDYNLYIGFSGDLNNRLKYHNEGKVKSTKGRRPFRLIFYEAYINKYDAKRREQYFKTTKGKKALKLMLRMYFDLLAGPIV